MKMAGRKYYGNQKIMGGKYYDRQKKMVEGK
jgi:hypothetical protein